MVCHSVRPSVRLPVTMFSATMHNMAAKKQYQCHTGLILICVLVLRSKVIARKPSKQANMLISMVYLDQILPL